MDRTKSDTIQIMRALAVIMVVLQHSIGRVASSNFQYKIMYLLNHIDVTVFFLISGYLYERKKTKYYSIGVLEFTKKKAKALLIPYAFWSLLIAVGVKICSLVIPEILYALNMEPWSWTQILINTLTYKNYYIQHLWFIYVLFLYFVLNYITRDLLIKRWFIIICVVPFVFVLNKIQMPFLLNKFFLHFFSFVCGRLIFAYDWVSFFQKRITTVMAGISLVICFISELYFPDSFTYSYGGHLLYALSGAQIIYKFSSMIAKKSRRGNFVMTKIGYYSFEIYLLHNPYITLTVPFLLGKMGVSPWINIVFTTIMGVFIPIFIVKILYKMNWFLPLLGRSGKSKRKHEV